MLDSVKRSFTEELEDIPAGSEIDYDQTFGNVGKGRGPEGGFDEAWRGLGFLLFPERGPGASRRRVLFQLEFPSITSSDFCPKTGGRRQAALRRAAA